MHGAAEATATAATAAKATTPTTRRYGLLKPSPVGTLRCVRADGEHISRSIVCLLSDNLGLWCPHAYLTTGSDPSHNNTEDPNDNEA